MSTITFDFRHYYRKGERRESDQIAYQWDLGHVAEIYVPVNATYEIHYCFSDFAETDDYAVESVTEAEDGGYKLTAHIPNKYFERSGELKVYVIGSDDNHVLTTYEGYISIRGRIKPDDYTDDDPENEATRILAEAREARDAAIEAAEQAEAAASQSAAQASIAKVYDATKTYAIGDYCLHDGQLYECTTEITTPEAWTAAHWTATTVGTELNDIKGDVTGLKEDLSESVGDLKSALNFNHAVPPGYLLRSTNSGNGNEWSMIGTPTDAQTETAINAWLTAHPEATTTVQDGSLTLTKFRGGELPFVTPEQFGAVGNGVVDDTAAITAAFNSGFPVALIKGKNYYVTSIEVTTPLLVYGNGATISTTCGESYLRVIICYTLAKTAIFYDVNFETTVGVPTTGAHGETIINRSKRTAISGYALEIMRVVGCTFNGFDTAIDGNVSSGDTTFTNVLDTLIVEDTLIKNALMGITRTFRHVFIDNCRIEVDKNAQSGEHCIYLHSDVLETANITSTVFDAGESSSGGVIQFWPTNGVQSTNIVDGTYVISNCILIGDGFVNLTGGGICDITGCDMLTINYNTTNRRRQFDCPQSSTSVINVANSNVNIELLDNKSNINFNACKLYSTAIVSERTSIANANNCEFINLGIVLYGAEKFRGCVFSSPVRVPGNYYVAVHNTASGGYMANCIFESDGTAITIAYNTSGSCSLVNIISSLPIGSQTSSLTVVNKIEAL